MTSLRTFVSRVPPHLLQALLERNGAKIDPPSESCSATAVAARISGRLEDLDQDERDSFAAEVERISAMANEAGEVAIEAVTQHELDGLPNSHARALSLFLADQDAFRRAEDVRATDEQRYGRKWTAVHLQKGLKLQDDPQAVEALREALKAHFGTENVHIDIFERSRQGFSGEHALTQLTIYREGRSNDELTFIDGTLGTRLHKPVFEAAVTFEAATGRLECMAPRRDNRDDIMQIVTEKLLGCPADFRPADSRVYNLDVLASRQHFPSDAEDLIDRVDVTMLRLMPNDTTAERITVEKLRGSTNDIWSTISTRLGNHALRHDYVITQAKLVIRHRASDSNQLRSLPITISHPDRSNLKEMTEFERLVANKYLPRWRLIVQ